MFCRMVVNIHIVLKLSCLNEKLNVSLIVTYRPHITRIIHPSLVSLFYQFCHYGTKVPLQSYANKEFFFNANKEFLLRSLN